MLDKGLEDVGVVVGLLALHYHAQALETHTGVDMFGLEGLEGAVGQTVVLHEYEVPYLNDQGVILVHQFMSGHKLFLRLVAQVDMYLAARAAGALLAHFPEIVLLRAFQNAALVDMLFPEVVSFGVHLQAVLCIAAKHGDVQVPFVDMHHLGQEFPTVSDGLAFEIVAKRPVAQHLEHGVVVSVVAHFLQVVVLAADAEAFLRIAGTGIGCIGIAEEDVLELVHAGVGEHEGGVVLDDHGCAGHHLVLLALEKVEECFAYFVACHNHLFIKIRRARP